MATTDKVRLTEFRDGERPGFRERYVVATIEARAMAGMLPDTRVAAVEIDHSGGFGWLVFDEDAEIIAQSKAPHATMEEAEQGASAAARAWYELAEDFITALGREQHRVCSRCQRGEPCADSPTPIDSVKVVVEVPAICFFDHNGTGPRCCVEVSAPGATHEGPHLFKCAGPSCPGLMWPASVMRHPVTCNEPVTVETCRYCLRPLDDCDCSDADESPDMGARG